MFSTVDQPASRFIKAFLTIDGSEYPLEIPQAFKVRTQRVKADPSDANLELLADKMESLGLTQLQTWAKPRMNTVDASQGIVCKESKRESAQLRIEMWRLRFDHQANEIHSRQFMEITRNLATDSPREVQ